MTPHNRQRESRLEVIKTCKHAKNAQAPKHAQKQTSMISAHNAQVHATIIAKVYETSNMILICAQAKPAHQHETPQPYHSYEVLYDNEESILDID